MRGAMSLNFVRSNTPYEERANGATGELFPNCGNVFQIITNNSKRAGT